MIQQWLSVMEAASALGVSESTVRRRAQREELPCRMNGSGRLEVLVDVATEEDAAMAAQLVARRGKMPVALPASEKPAGVNEAEGNAAAAECAEPSEAVAAAEATEATATEANAAGESNEASGAADAAEHAHHDDDDQPGEPTDIQRQQNPFMQAADGNGPVNESLSRYQRMAGASIVLAQQQADEAAEALAHARHDLAKTTAKMRVGFGAAIGFACLTMLMWVGQSATSPRLPQAQASAVDPAIRLNQLLLDEVDGLNEQLADAQQNQANMQTTLDTLQDKLEQLVNQTPGTPGAPVANTSTSTTTGG